MFSFSSNKSNDTHSKSHNHHCPTCKCTTRNPSSNLYLSPSHYSDPLALTFNPFQMSSQLSPRSSSLTPYRNKLNITFAYSNPILLRNRSQGKLSTKEFKNKKFPHFNEKDFLQKPILQIFKGKSKQKAKSKENNMRQKNSDNKKEQQSKKGQKVKMNKIKSNKYLELQSRKSSSSLNINSKQSSQFLCHNQEQIKLKQQFKTPIEQFKQTPIEHFKQNTTPPTPIVQVDYLPQIKSKKSIKKEEITPKRGQLLQINNTNKYPTIKSIQVYQKCTPQQQLFIQEEGSQTSLKVQEPLQGSEFKKMGLIQASDEQIANHISQELSLNYDYMWVLQESDRSLSLQVQL